MATSIVRGICTALVILATTPAIAAAPPKVTSALSAPLPLPYDEAADAKAQVTAAIARAKAAHKFVLLDFGGNWCPDCRIFMGVLQMKEVRPAVASTFEIVPIDVGRLTKNMEIGEQYGVKITAVPTVIILNGDGRRLNGGDPAALSDARSMTPQSIVDTVFGWIGRSGMNRLWLSPLLLATALHTAQSYAEGDAADLAGTTATERAAIEGLCGNDRSVIAHHMCLTNQLVGLLRTARSPDLSVASPEQRQAIDKVCAAKAIPAERFACDRAQLKAANLPVRDEPGVGPLNVAAAGGSPFAPPKVGVGETSTAFPTFSLEEWRRQRPPMPRAQASVGQLNATGVYQRIWQSVYIVTASDQPVALSERSAHAQGSAVAISDRLLLTNCHVVAGRPQIQITQQGKNGHATLAYADPAGDRCFLRSDDFPVRPVQGVRHFSDLKVGETVFSLGAPVGLETSFNQGLVSALRQNEGVHIIQNSAPSWHGSSGGGLFDAHGNLIGITTAAATAVPDTYFSIAADDFWP